MSNIKLFRYSDNDVQELAAHYGQTEKELHDLIERNMEKFLGIRFLAREYGTGRVQRGYIDSLGIDENSFPVIIEYKRRNNDNVLCQGLYYLNWLMDHQGDFINLVRARLGDEAASAVEFSGTRVICIASDFSRYDELAVQQIDKNLELIRYRLYANDLVLFEVLQTAVSPFIDDRGRIQALPENDAEGDVGMPAQMQARIRGMSPEVERLYLDFLAFAENLGDDIQIKFLKHYIALVRFKNFACIQPLKKSLKVWLNLNPDQIVLEEGFTRDVRDIGHHSSGNLEVDIADSNALERARPLVELAYRNN